MKKVAEWKKEIVNEIKDLCSKYRVIAAVDLTNLPTLQLQRMRQQLKKELLLKTVKKRLIKIALDSLNDEKISGLKEHIKGSPALIFTNEDPFKLCKVLSKSKSKAPAKAGQTAQGDIIISAGPTPFTPGPIIGELGQAGIKTEVKEGKVNIKEDKLLVREGEVINAKAADILNKLKIEPMEIGLNLMVAYDNGIIYDRKVLSVDEKEYINNIRKVSRDAINLAIAIGYANKDVIGLMVKKAYTDAELLARARNISLGDNKIKDDSKIEGGEPKNL